jgi:hypothetical protein
MAFVAALVAGLLALLSPLFFQRGSAGLHEARAFSALIAAAAFGLGAALLFGGTVLVRDLAEKRLAFYFARPFSAFAVWAGKLGAAVALTFALAFLGLLPTLLVEGNIGVFRAGVFPFAALLAVFVVVIADAVMAALRSRSPWLLIDLVLLGAVAAAVVWALGKLFVEGWWGFGPPHPALVGLVVSVPVLILLAASFARVASGRSDMRRSHGAQSVTLWSLALPLTAAFVGFTAWLSSPTPDDLIEVRKREKAPKGGWEFVSGTARHRGDVVAAFLRKRETGHFARLSRRAGYGMAFSEAFSADGRRAAWTELTGNRPPLEIVAADVDSGTPRIIRTGLLFSYPWPELALSPSGSRLATLQNDILTVYEIPDPALPRSVAMVRLPDALSRSLSFEEGRVLISPPRLTPSSKEPRELPGLVFDIHSKTLSALPPGLTGAFRKMPP